MTILKAWFVEEIDLGDGKIGHRETVMNFDDATGEWVRPDDKLTVVEQAEWDRVMYRYSEDRSMVHPVALMDHCHGQASRRKKN